MKPVEVLENIYWVGAVDWNVRNFHGFTYSTPRGTTYNAYLIVDGKIVLVDCVYAPFGGEMMERIREIVEPEKIDYIVINHVETDHSGALAEVLKFAPKAKVVGTARCKEGLLKHYFFRDWNFQVVKTGDEINLGERTLSFIEAPMLHWPDSMFTYVGKDGLLLPNDAFGQHLATSKRFDDEVDENILMEEAAKYYANILWPFSSLVIKKIEELQQRNLSVAMIAPSHGVIWRSNPAKILEAYLCWARGEAEKKILVVYDTMWGSTEKMAKAIVEGIRREGVEVRLFRLPLSDRGALIRELLEAKGLLVGSSTINSGILPTLASFLEDLKGLKPRKKVAAAFGSYGWGGGAVRHIEEALRQAGIEILSPGLTVKWVPDEEETRKCLEYGEEFARKI
ncbi:FprA family A-type flavoprotein [Candidatus Hecatella orcuttiae]|uniref:FprA family A-type flavoprotein n=1 Tax=Candidatus Hecatella orcuttiae TaxID=1935119 RepID=UPI002867EF1F|nr:flavodoxin domain-containing protein [Candidatus Hecatella orcuttiae]